MNILLNSILTRRGLITREQKWEDWKIVGMSRDDITIGTEHWLSDGWKEKVRLPGAKMKPDLVWLHRDSDDQW